MSLQFQFHVADIFIELLVLVRQIRSLKDRLQNAHASNQKLNFCRYNLIGLNTPRNPLIYLSSICTYIWESKQCRSHICVTSNTQNLNIFILNSVMVLSTVLFMITRSHFDPSNHVFPPTYIQFASVLWSWVTYNVFARRGGVRIQFLNLTRSQQNQRNVTMITYDTYVLGHT